MNPRSRSAKLRVITVGGIKCIRSGKPSRRRQEVRVPFPTILVVVLTLSVVIGAGYMSINIRCSGLGKQIKQQERKIVETQKRFNG